MHSISIGTGLDYKNVGSRSFFIEYVLWNITIVNDILKIIIITGYNLKKFKSI